MQEALKEARKGIGLTSPNPPVGAVIVKDGILLARGWHEKAGTAHAERNALARLKDPKAAKGASIYVTLEPCSTHGRTGACSTAIIEAGITRVVYGATDPNPAHVGRANTLMQEAGIEVLQGICQQECEQLIRAFSKVQRTGMPWVIAKTAMSLDGCITRPKGEGQWLTGPEARETVQLLRSEVDCIITSGETVRRDDPALTLRSAKISEKKQQPLKVVLTKVGLNENRYQIFQGENKARQVVEQPLEETLKLLVSNDQVNTVLLESGGELMGAFLDAGLVDEMVIYLAPIVTGGPSAAIGGKGANTLSERLNMSEIIFRQIGPDLVMRGIVNEQQQALER